MGYYTAIILVVFVGLATVAFSRYQAHHQPPSPKPTLSDHWHAAFAFDICGNLLPNPPQNTNVPSAGLHTHGDGLIHVEPLSSADTGHNATLGRFVKLYAGMGLSSTSLRYPGRRTWTNGDRCGKRPGKVQVEVWASASATKGRVVTADPGGILIEQGEVITMAFVPPGTAIPKPRSLAALATAGGTPGNTPAGAKKVPVKPATKPATTPHTTTTAPHTTTTAAHTATTHP